MKKGILEEDIENIAKRIQKEAKRLEGKTLLITGGAGFLGKYFILTIDHLNKTQFKKPCRVISVDNFVTGSSYPIKEGPAFKAIQHDVSKPLKIDEPIHFILSAAGIASPKFYRKYIIETIDVGIFGTKHMLELAKEKKIESMVFFSSSEVYGDPDPQFVPTPETYNGNVSCTGPRSNYDESKRLGETLCVAYHQVHKVPVKAVRPFNVYGPLMRLDDYRVIPNFIAHVLQNKPIPVYGAGNNTRTFCYITDAMVGFLKVLLCDHNGEAFNVGNEHDEINMSALGEIVSEIYDNKPKIAHVLGPTDAYTKADPKRRCPDLSKIQTKLGYETTVDLKAGIKRFVQWVDESDQKKLLS